MGEWSVSWASTDDAAQRSKRVRRIDALRNEITELAGHLNAANDRFLKMIAEFDRLEGWVDNETQSCAHWLNWKCDIDLEQLAKKNRVARALEDLPKISAAMERGEISYSNVRAITRVACPRHGRLLAEHREARDSASRGDNGALFAKSAERRRTVARSATTAAFAPPTSAHSL